MRATFDAMLDLMEPMFALGQRTPALIPNLRLRMEISVIAQLARRMMDRARAVDPLADNARLGKAGKLAALLFGVAHALLPRKAS
jgi:hypothetical protein